jgi:hypothetical protein
LCCKFKIKIVRRKACCEMWMGTKLKQLEVPWQEGVSPPGTCKFEFWKKPGVKCTIVHTCTNRFVRFWIPALSGVLLHSWPPSVHSVLHSMATCARHRPLNLSDTSQCNDY